VAAVLDIREVSDGLLIRVVEPRNIKRIILTIVVGIISTLFFLLATGGSRPLLFLLGAFLIFSLIKDLIQAIRGTDVQLHITNLDFVSTGRAPDGYRTSSIPRASIYNLFYKEASGGEDVRPSGLYIEHQGILTNPETCVLPHIDKAQTSQAIEAILHRFPDTESLAPVYARNSPITTLNLNRP
jgi:hypothetical protein